MPMEYILLAALGLAAYLWIAVFVVEAFRQPALRQMKGFLREQRNRDRLGLLRTKLMAGVRRGTVDPTTTSFDMLYLSITYLLRHPELHERFVEKILHNPEAQRAADPEKMTKAEAELASELLHTIDQMCRDHDLVYRAMAALLDRIPEQQEERSPLWVAVLRHSQRAARARAVHREERRYQRRVLQLSPATA